MTESKVTFQFPTLKRLQLKNFTLYSATPNINLEFGPGVLCLAGANGIGKSTFLAALNFALTGRVPNPDLSFKSIEEYFEHPTDFSAAFFAGRIDESDRDASEVLLEVSLGPRHYRLRRGLFERDQLRSLEIRIEGGKSESFESMNDSEKHETFTRLISKDIGVSSFEQFVFLQHFVFTFDERRHLLFWDPRVLERVLYLAFGWAPAEANLADSYQRNIERAESLARNAKWQANETRTKLLEIEQMSGVAKKTAASKSVLSDYERLRARIDEVQKQAEDREARIRDEALNLSSINVQQLSLREQYNAAFETQLLTMARTAGHPLIRDSIQAKRCAICGASGEGPAKRIAEKLKLPICPLCDSDIEEKKPNPETLESLKKLDLELLKAKRAGEESSSHLKRLREEGMKCRKQQEELAAALGEFEKMNEEALKSLASQKGEDLQGVLAAFRKVIEERLAQRDEQRKIRDKNKKLLAELQKKLAKGYADVEQSFVPSFRELAHLFLGLEVDIRLEQRAAPSISLVLEVVGKARRERHELSESQRFFVDIALRMALAKYMAGDNKATMYIDTPEGSLDIAYEKKAGIMFANFVKQGHSIVMTANINTSQLLINLASHCGEKFMRIVRMLEWAELSDVQEEEEQLFTRAFASLTTSLKAGSK